MAESVRETMNIGNICRGGVMERFERALDEVFKNIDDINRPATAKRAIGAWKLDAIENVARYLRAKMPTP